jgi:hypothetical protein
MEKTSGLILFVSALAVLLHESARNDFALNWVIMVIVLGSTLWMSPSKLCGIFKTLLILVIVALAFVLLKEGVYVKESWVAVCAADPLLAICQFRTILGKVIYLNYVGLSGIVEKMTDRVNKCFNCDKEGHFARECTEGNNCFIQPERQESPENKEKLGNQEKEITEEVPVTTADKADILQEIAKPLLKKDPITTDAPVKMTAIEEEVVVGI